jgi:ornithine cyclodeaminase
VVSLMDMGEAIGALEEGLRAEARGEASNMTKTHVAWGGATLHAIGAAFPAEGFAGTKTWAHTEGGATPLLVLYDARDGSLRAVIEAFALGQLRTGAASGVATRLLAAADADELAIIGAGKQALPQIAAVAAVRPLRRVRVYSRDAGRCAAFARRVQDELGIPAVCTDSIQEAVRDAKIVTTATRAKEPVLSASMLAKGAHVNAIGAITASGAEVEGDVLARCGAIVVDTLEQAKKLSRELIDHVAAGGSWEHVHTLASFLAAGLPRPESADLTLFKSLGMGISDLSLGIELLKRAEADGLGRRLPHPERASPRLRPRKSVPQKELLSGKARV